MRKAFHLLIAFSVAGLFLAKPLPAHATGGTLYVVTSTVAGVGECTLPEAIAAANTSTTTADCPSAGSTTINTIHFDMDSSSDPGYSGGIYTITLTSAPLTVTSPLILDGTSQGGYAGTPIVHLHHTTTTQNTLELNAGSDGSTVKGLMFTTAVPKIDLLVNGANNITIQGNYFDSDGSSRIGSSIIAVDLYPSSNDLVGGDSPADRNLFANTGNYSVYIQNPTTTDQSNNNTIKGNYFGLRPDGITLLSGQATGGKAVALYPAGGSLTGTTLRDNVIAKFATGVHLYPGADQNTIAGNLIGLGADGSTALGGSGSGISLYNASSNTIGGTTAADRNVISNYVSGVLITGSSNSNVIEGNYIGTDASGATPKANGYGVRMYGGDGNRIGGFLASERNVISGNSTNIFIAGNSSTLLPATNNVIRGNYIGLSADGSSKVGTPVYGIDFTSDGGYGANNNIIQFNKIAGGSSGAIQIQGAGDDSNLIQGNYVGTDAAGAVALGDGTGITLSAGANNVIGGNGDIGKRNLIAGNSDYEIYIEGGSGTVIADNVLGMNAAGTAQIDSATVGVAMMIADAQIARNWVGVGGNGIWLTGTATLNSGSSNNCLLGNSPQGLTNSTGTSVTFQDNWWGSATGPYNATSNAAGTGTPVSDDVDFDPWALSAQAICSPFANLAISSLGFGNQLAGTSRIQKFTVYSAGTKPLHLSSLGAPGAPFSVVPSAGTCSTSTPLAVGSNCQVAVKFAPTATGSFSSNLSLGSDSVPPAASLPLTGKGIAGTQLLKNPGFEIDANLDKKPDNWSYSNFIAATDKRDCSIRKSGTCSLKFQGNGTLKVASQSIAKTGVAGDDFTFALWSKASSVPVGSVYRLQVLFYNNSTLKATKTMNFNVGTHIFQKVSGTFTASTAYTKIVYRIQFKAASGTAWFDAAGLMWAP